MILSGSSVGLCFLFSFLCFVLGERDIKSFMTLIEPRLRPENDNIST